MWSGKKTLQEINQAMSGIRNDVHHYDAELNSLTEAIAHNQQQQTQIIKSIAKIRLSEIDRGGVVEALDSLDHEVERLLAKRDKSLADVEEQIQNLARELELLEQQRDELSKDVEKKQAVKLSPLVS